MTRLGIIGLPNDGKTTLFNALTGLDAVVAPHAFSTTEPNLGVAPVPDPVLERGAIVEGSAKTVYATLDLLDLPALRDGGGLGARFLGKAREMEALLIVLRSFEDKAVPAAESGTAPVDQAESLILELALADAEVFGRKEGRLAKEVRADPSLRLAADAISRATRALENGEALRSRVWAPEDRAAFADLAPLTLKRAVWVVNVAEDEPDGDALGAAVASVVPEGDTVIVLSARIEEEAARLDSTDRAELLEGFGLGEGALARVVQATYEAMGLISFYTLGPKEAHAWTVRRGSGAAVAGGKIHSDLERGFIRAEVMTMDDALDAGGWDAAKAGGLMRLEGKGYEVAEGDVLLIRFSV